MNAQEQSKEAYPLIESCSNQSTPIEVFIDDANKSIQMDTKTCIIQNTNSYNITSGNDNHKPFDVLPWLALTVSVISIWYTWHNNKIQRRISVEDDYWLRTVVFPSILNPLIDIGINSPEYLRSAESLADFFSEYFLQEMNGLRDKTMVLKLVDEKLYSDANQIMDDLDDSMSEVQTIDDYCRKFGEFSSKLTSLLKDAQSKT